MTIDRTEQLATALRDLIDAIRHTPLGVRALACLVPADAAIAAYDTETRREAETGRAFTPYQLRAVIQRQQEEIDALRLRVAADGKSDEWHCYVTTSYASNGITYLPTIARVGNKSDGLMSGTMTPHEFKERWKAEYEAAEWDAFLNAKPEPDMMAYGPDTHPNEAPR